MDLDYNGSRLVTKTHQILTESYFTVIFQEKCKAVILSRNSATVKRGKIYGQKQCKQLHTIFKLQTRQLSGQSKF